jgi:hypothetical protein
MKYIFIVFFALLFSYVDAQNLQFSQVLTYNLQPEESIVVPVSKVWKIASLSQGGVSSHVRVNNAVISYGVASGYPAASFPIWLKSGDEIKPYNSSAFFSIIEFTVVP